MIQGQSMSRVQNMGEPGEHTPGFYLESFGFSERPFTLVPDPSFFYWSDIPIDTPVSVEVYEDIEILEFEATEVEDDVEDDVDQLSLSPIFLWDFIKV